MAGLTENGFTPKRLAEIINDLRIRAEEIFKDLLEDEEDFVDTSEVSTIGRFIGLISTANEKNWQQLELLWSALDPDSATGYSLDVIGKLQGVVRDKNTYSNVTMILEGDLGTTIPVNSVVYSSTTNNEFASVGALVLDNKGLVSATFEPLIVSDNTTYSFSYIDGAGSAGTVSFTSPSSGTTSSVIVNGLATQISSYHPTLEAEVLSNTQIKVKRSDIYNHADFNVVGNLTIVRSSKMTSFRSVQYGAISGEPNTLTGIKTPVAGWVSAYNPSRVIEGVSTESDDDYRYRLSRTKMIRGTNLMDTLYSTLMELSGVKSVRIYENESDTVDEKGLPAHSFMPVVLGGDTQEIGRIIWNNEPAGIASHGTTSTIVYDAQEFPQTVRFQRPEPVNIYVRVMITKETDLFPFGGEDAIKNNIVVWANNNYKVGETVLASRLYTPANQVNGHKINAIYVSKDPSPTSGDEVEVGYIEIPTFSTINIEVVES